MKEENLKLRFNYKALLDFNQLEELKAIIESLPDEEPDKHLYKNRKVFEYEIEGDFAKYVIRLNWHWKVITVFEVLPLKE